MTTEMTALEFPVHITVVVEYGDGESMVHRFTPGESLTDDGVQYESGDSFLENRDRVKQRLTTHRITWTEVGPA